MTKLRILIIRFRQVDSNSHATTLLEKSCPMDLFLLVAIFILKTIEKKISASILGGLSFFVFIVWRFSAIRGTTVPEKKYSSIRTSLRRRVAECCTRSLTFGHLYLTYYSRAYDKILPRRHDSHCIRDTIVYYIITN